MNISPRVALSLGLAACCGGGLLFSLRTAKGQPAPTPTVAASGASASGAPQSGAAPAPPSGAASAPAPAAGTAGASATAMPGAPVFNQTIGNSPAPGRATPIFVFGGTGNGEASYDLQSQNVYSLLQQRGVPIPNVLHPDSTAKPSFIVERLIVVSLSGAPAAAAAQPTVAPATTPNTPGGATPGAAATAVTVRPPTDAERTVTSVRRVVEAELSRGSGRIGGNHRRKLELLRSSLVSLEKANSLGGAVANAVAGSAGGQSNDKKSIDFRELFYGRARAYARAADQVAPKGF